MSRCGDVESHPVLVVKMPGSKPAITQKVKMLINYNIIYISFYIINRLRGSEISKIDRKLIEKTLNGSNVRVSPMTSTRQTIHCLSNQH